MTARLLPFSPDIIINAAAYTNVDQAEHDQDTAFAVNATAVGYLVDYCIDNDCAMIHLSTNYVFDGHQHAPYHERCTPNPINVYGASKLAGEQILAQRLPRHIIVRLSAVFSPWRHNFVKTIIKLAQENPCLRIVSDQITCLTPADAIADLLCQLATALYQGKVCFGCYHYCGDEAVSWYQAACIIVDHLHHYDEHSSLGKVVAIPTTQFPQPANRPLYSVMSNKKLHRQWGIPPAPWREGLARVIHSLLT